MREIRIDVDKIVREYLSRVLSTSRLVREGEEEEFNIIPIEHLYGVPVYVVGRGVLGQFRRYYTLRDSRGRLKWIIECARQITIYGVRDGIWYPLVVYGLPTVYVLERRFDYFLVHESPERVTVEVFENDILNLDRVARLQDPILIIDPYRLARDRVPTHYWGKYMELQEMVRQAQEVIYNLESELSETRSMLSIRESEIAYMRRVIDLLRDELAKLRVEVTNYYLEYIRLKNEVRLQTRLAEFFENMFYRLEGRIRSIEERVGRELAGRREEVRKSE